MELPKVICPYCGKEAELVDSRIVYGKSYGMIWLCRECIAYVGCQKGTNIPLGRLADANLRHWKQAAHECFDPIWRYGKFAGDRDAAYKWLSEKMQIPFEETHIGKFDEAQCKAVIKIINEGFIKGELQNGQK